MNVSREIFRMVWTRGVVSGLELAELLPTAKTNTIQVAALRLRRRGLLMGIRARQRGRPTVVYLRPEIAAAAERLGHTPETPGEWRRVVRLTERVERRTR